MNNIDEIVDLFVQKLGSDGIAIESYTGIHWIDLVLKRLPARFPPSFMSLISRYIFDDIEVGKLWFYANRGDQEYEELYDLAVDPEELENLIPSGRFRKEHEQFRKALLRWLTATEINRIHPVAENHYNVPKIGRIYM